MTHSVRCHLVYQLPNKKSSAVKADSRPGFAKYPIPYLVLSFWRIIVFRFLKLEVIKGIQVNSQSDWKLGCEDCFLDYQLCSSLNLFRCFMMIVNILNLCLAQL